MIRSASFGHLKGHYLKGKCLIFSSANAAPEFQGRGGDEIASQIVNLLTNLYSSKNFDLSQLCIVSGKKCWHLFIDIVVGYF